MRGISTDHFQQSRRVRFSAEAPDDSRLAKAAVALSCVAWMLPLAPAVALLLGGRAWVRANNRSKSKRLAVAAMALAFVGLGLQGIMSSRGYEVYRVLNLGPASAMAQGSGGDVSGFLSSLNADEDQREVAQAFLAQLESRYGRFIRGTAKETPAMLQALSGQETNSTYLLEFERGVVTAHARHHPATGMLRWPAPPQLRQVGVEDAIHGPLEFPPLAPASIEATTSAP